MNILKSVLTIMIFNLIYGDIISSHLNNIITNRIKENNAQKISVWVYFIDNLELNTLSLF